MNHQILYDIIFDCLKQEDEELSPITSQGIFFAPELYVAFIIGKNIKRRELDVFDNRATWYRETDLKNGGPSDFAFNIEGQSTYVFELKMRQTIQAYNADINKLKNLNPNHQKIFIALVDAWEKDKEADPRITGLETYHPDLIRIAAFQSFPTKQDRYQGKIWCTLGVWILS